MRECVIKTRRWRGCNDHDPSAVDDMGRSANNCMHLAMMTAMNEQFDEAREAPARYATEDERRHR